MKNLLTPIILLLCSMGSLFAQTTTHYEVSFENRVHHEAQIKVTFDNVDDKVLEVLMSRSSPGRYAVHDFAKNVYSVKATDGAGNDLTITRPSPRQWNVTGHSGHVVFEYTLYANRAGGTYSGIDESHAHLNMPATFVWAKDLDHRPIEITYDLPDSSNWKVATQMKDLGNNTFQAPNNYYFMDSPTEIADFFLKEQMVNDQNIRLAIHTDATQKEVDTYFKEVIKIVEQQAAVFGELPAFDFGEYTFLSCYVPNASGDGMEHRNSTYVVSRKPTDQALGNRSMGTISHEFFHAWNVERIRPASLEPFDFEDANMSGELWFAEGFTSYYTNLIRARSGNISKQDYVNGLGRTVSYVQNAPGRKYHNPIEMSYRAPFVDAASSIDPTNNNNIFVSYYTYGSVLGLALDMSLRTMDKGLSLDGYMAHVWKTQGKSEVSYTVKDLQARLGEYAGDEFSENFFSNYIYKSRLPNFKSLFAQMGIQYLAVAAGEASLGGNLKLFDGYAQLTTNAPVGSALYNAGIEREDHIIAIAGVRMEDIEKLDVAKIIKQYDPGDDIEISIERWGKSMWKKVTLGEDKQMKTQWDGNANADAIKRRNAWLKKN